jgi:hypothetical protein
MDVDTSESRLVPGRDVAQAQEALMRELAEHTIKFSEHQAAQLGEALFQAELSLLQAIVREAERLESFDAVRNIPRLVAALQGLRSCMGQGLEQQRLWAMTAGGRHGWFAYPPGMMDEGEDVFDED